MAVVGVFLAKSVLSYIITRAVSDLTAREKKPTALEGPTRRDLSVQTCSWGTAIPVVYGSMRLSGNIIWTSLPIDDLPSATLTLSLAIGICRGPVTNLGRIWCNGQLVYDAVHALPTVAADSVEQHIRTALSFEFFKGTEDQEVAAEIQAGLPMTLRFYFWSISLSAPPADPPNGTWFVHGTGTGAWTGHGGQLAFCSGGAWTFALTSWIGEWYYGVVYVLDDSKVYEWNGSAWVQIGVWNPTIPPGYDGPAYRGLCYIVFKDFPLHLTGGAIPQFEFEVANIASSAPYEEIPEQTETTWNEPPAGEGIFQGQLLSMTGFECGIAEGLVYSGNVSVGTDGLTVAPTTVLAYWELPVVTGMATQPEPYGNILLRVDTPPASLDVTICELGSTIVARLKLTPSRTLKLTKADGTLLAHSDVVLAAETWHRVSFGARTHGAALCVDGIDATIDLGYDPGSIKDLVLGSVSFVAAYSVTFRSAALTSHYPLPTNWKIDAVEVAGTLSGYAEIGSSNGSPPYWSNGSTDQALMLGLVNRHGGWDGAHATPNYPNQAEEVHKALRSTAAASFVGTIAPLDTSLHDYSLSRFYGIQVALTCRAQSSGSFVCDIQNIPGSADRTVGLAATLAYGAWKQRREAYCASSPGYWTPSQIEAIVLKFSSAGSESHVHAHTVYVVHSGLPLIEHSVLIEPGTSVNMDPIGNSGQTNGGGGANVVLAVDDSWLVFMESGRWYAYAIVLSVVSAYGTFLEDLDSNGTLDPLIPPVGCDFDMDEDAVIYTAKIGDPTVVYDHYDYTTMEAGDSQDTHWPLTIDIFVNGNTVQSSDFTIPELSGHYLDLDLDVKVDGVVCDATHHPYVYDAGTNTIVFVQAPPMNAEIRVAWGFERTLPAKASIVRLDPYVLFGEISASDFADWDLYYPARIRVGRSAGAPVAVMGATNSDSSPGSTIRLRNRTDFEWGGYVEAAVGPASGSLFRAMTIDDVVRAVATHAFFAVSSDGDGAAELVIAMLNGADPADPVRFDISDYITDPEVIMVWDSTATGEPADRIAVGQRGAQEKIAFWSFEVLSNGDLEITYLGQLGGEVVPAQATAAWRRGAWGNPPALTFAYDNGGPTVIKTIDLTSRNVRKTWAVLPHEDDAGGLPDFRGGSAYSATQNGVFSGCVPVSSVDEYSYIWVSLQTIITSPLPLSAIVADICSQAGLEGGEIDVTDLAQTVHGYAVDNRMEARSALAPLADAYAFDGIESGGKLNFRKRTGISAVEIPASDLAAHVEGTERPQDLVTSMMEEVSIPVSVEIGFVDFQSEYGSGLVRDMRSGGTSGEKMALSIPVALTKGEAKALAARQLMVVWQEGSRYKLILTRQYAYLDPGDVVTITTPTGLRLPMRVETMTPSGGLIEIEAVPDSPIPWET